MTQPVNDTYGYGTSLAGPYLAIDVKAFEVTADPVDKDYPINVVVEGVVYGHTVLEALDLMSALGEAVRKAVEG